MLNRSFFRTRPTIPHGHTESQNHAAILSDEVNSNVMDSGGSRGAPHVQFAHRDIEAKRRCGTHTIACHALQPCDALADKDDVVSPHGMGEAIAMYSAFGLEMMAAGSFSMEDAIAFCSILSPISWGYQFVTTDPRSSEVPLQPPVWLWIQSGSSTPHQLIWVLT